MLHALFTPLPTSLLFLILTLLAIVASFFLGRRMAVDEVGEPHEFAFVLTKDGCLGVRLVLCAGERFIELQMSATRELSCEIAEGISTYAQTTPEDKSQMESLSVGMVVPFDIRLCESQKWEELRLQVAIDLPAKIHDCTEVITALGLEKWHKNPAVHDVNGFRKFPIGVGRNATIDSNRIELDLEMSKAHEAGAVIQGLQNGKCALCAYVAITAEVDGGGWSGELVAIEAYVVGERPTSIHTATPG
jgi:hypothetical protein